MSKKKSTYSALLSVDRAVANKPKPTPKKANSNMANKPGTSNQNNNKRSRSRTPMQGKKFKSFNKPAEMEEIDYDVPDRSFGDLYCKPCDSHMNSEQMWEAHIQGKRHLKHVKKGDPAELKYDYVDEVPLAQKDIDLDTNFIVGLQHLVEIQRNEQRPTYQCFLCSGNVPCVEQLVDHLIGFKHRLAYLKEHDMEAYNLIQSSGLRKGHMETVVEEYIQKHEQENGRGRMLVKREKPTKGTPNEKKPIKIDYSGSSRPHAPIRRDYQTPDWKRRRSQSPYSDRSFEGFSDRKLEKPPMYSSAGWSTDREDPYYNRSPDYDYRRPVYKDRLSPDIYSEPTYSRNSERSTYDEERYGDLREVLEKKKTSDSYRAETITSDTESTSFLQPSNSTLGSSFSNILGNSSITSLSGSSPLSSMTGNIPDSYLKVIEAMTPTIFLQLAVFKLNRMELTTEFELKLLDKVVNLATALSMEIKANQLPPNLQEQFKETMVQSGIGVTPEFSKDFEKLMKMVGQYKASCKTENTVGNSVPKVASSQESFQSQPVYNSVYHTQEKASVSGASVNIESNYTPQTINYTPQPVNYTPQPVNYTPQPVNRNPTHSWQPAVSTSSSSLSSNLFPTASSSIPGLTLTNDYAPSQSSSPFDLLSRQAKDILGAVRTKTDSYRY